MLKDNQVQAITTILKDLESKEQDITIGLLLKGLQRMEAEERHRMAQFVVGGEPESALVSRERLDKITEFFHVLYEHPVVKDRLAARKKKESDDLSGEIAAILLG